VTARTLCHQIPAIDTCSERLALGIGWRDTARDHTRTKASKALRDACADALGPEMALRFAGTFLDELTFGNPSSYRLSCLSHL
jgi:hypothetical protein